MLKRPFLTRLASYSQHGFDTNLSHPILRIKLNALTHVCPGINHTHKLTNYIKYHHGVSYIRVIVKLSLIHHSGKITR